MGRVPFFPLWTNYLNGSLMVHDVTLLAPSCLPGLSSSQLLAVLAGAKMRLQMTSRSHGGWLRAVWSSGVTVTAPQNEEQSTCLGRLLTAPPTLYQRAAPSFHTYIYHGVSTTLIYLSILLCCVACFQVFCFQTFCNSVSECFKVGPAMGLHVLTQETQAPNCLSARYLGRPLSIAMITLPQSRAVLHCSTAPCQASTYCYIWLQSVCVCKLEGQPLPIVRLEHAMTKHAISIQQHL